jgi:predicted helicase
MPHLPEALDRLKADISGKYHLGRAFEKLVRNALLANPQYKDRFTNLWLWPEWPEAGGADLGIDLVGEQTEDYGGGLCAIQCKFYASASVSITEVDKFLAFTVGERWRGRIFVATSNYSRNARKKLEAAQAEIITSGDLDTWPVGDWRDLIERPDNTLRWAADRHIPRPHQEEALEAIGSGLFGTEAHHRGRVLMPCGSGKSEVALWAAERNVAWGGRVLYLVPSIALMSQTMRTWAYQGNPDIPHRYLAVCSDSKAAKDSEDANLSELAMPVTTNAQDIASKLKREAPEAMTVVFSTYQSLPVVSKAQELGAPPFDLAICDEAHRTTGVEQKAKAEESPFQLVHNPVRLEAERRLFMTATQRLYASGWKKQAGGEVYSMDDEDLYGPILYEQSFRDAIDAGLLSDYEVVVIAYGEDHQIQSYDRYWKDYQDKTGKIPKTQILNAEDWVQLVGCWDALADPTTTGLDRERPAGSINPFYTCRRGIAFTNKIANSRKVEQHWRAVCDNYRQERSRDYREHPVVDLDVVHIDGKQNAYERAEKVQWLRGADQPEGTTRVLTNARCLSEGVDIPALDAVLFLAPRQSEVDIVQAVGRVMRRAEGKDKGYIVIPVLVPDGQTLQSEEFLKGSNFQQVWKVCRALRAHDERFDAMVNAPGLAGESPLRIIDRTGMEPLEPSLQESLPGLLPEIASALVDQVGDRHYWPSWGREAAAVYRKVFSEVNRKTRSGAAETAVDAFVEQMRDTVMPAFGRQDAIEMIAQHAVTIPVFDAFFSDHSFRDVNPVSIHLNSVLEQLEERGVNFDQMVQPLQRSYDRIATVFEDVSEDTDPAASKLQILQDVYEGFFAAAIPDVVKRLGIVYTPIPLVDFMLRSADAACRKHFGKSLSDPEVEILDPFTGTGTFLSRLLTIKGTDGGPLIRDADVARKYQGELWANDLVLLAYYIAALKIEQSAASRGAFEAKYQPFDGIVLRDTFSSSVTGRLDLDQNPERAREQDTRTIRVIIANPPWSAGQKSSDDNNPNLKHADMEQRVRETYSKKHREVTGRGAGKSAGNTYVQSFRWATDRLGDPEHDRDDRHGMVVLIHPNSLINGTSLAGMRAALRDEFSHLYVVNLRGDAKKPGDEWHREGDKLFGGGATIGVQITVAVRSPNHDPDRPGKLYYAEVPEYSSLDQKFAWLNELGDVTSPDFVEVPTNPRHDWINLTDGTFEQLLPVCHTSRNQSAQVAVHSSALGLTTACDTYVYSFSRVDLIQRINTLIDAYEDARVLHELGEPFDDVTANDQQDAIKWTERLKQSLKQNLEIVFDESRISEVLYRPFTKLWLYEDDRILSSVKTISAMFPRDSESVTPPPEGILINLTRQIPFGVVATDRLFDLCATGRQTRAMPARRS